jgi:hypothetical protein
MSTPAWMQKGDNLKQSELMKSSTKPNVYGFWLNPGVENARNILFLDDPQILIASHSLWIDGKSEDYTCLVEDCPACAKNYWRTPIMPYTILDLTPFKDKTGKERKYSRKPFLAKGKTVIELLEDRRMNSGGTLAGLKIRVIRSEKKSANCGDDFQVLGRIDIANMNLPKEDIKLYDYAELLRPVTAKQLEAALKYAAPPKGKKSRTVSRDSLAETDPFATETEHHQEMAGTPGADTASGDFGPEPQFNSSDEIPF